MNPDRSGRQIIINDKKTTEGFYMSISITNLAYIRKLVQQEAGIIIEDGKEYLVENRLLPLAQNSGFNSIDDFITHLQSQPINGAHHKLINALTINETSFFRDIHPFDSLRDSILPELIKKREVGKTIRIWCAACSSGQEPYSIAILLKEHFPAILNQWSITILGTDINDEILDKAKQGIYTQLEVNRGLPVKLLIKYFTKLPDQRWQIKDEIKRLVTFRQQNLVSPLSSMNTFDIIFMRNVLIYFNTEIKQKILKQVRSVLADDGCLILGASESTCFYDDSFEPRQAGKTTVYVKK